MRYFPNLICLTVELVLRFILDYTHVFCVIIPQNLSVCLNFFYKEA